MPVSRAIVLGVLSLILWSLIIVVTVKYVLILLRADNNGEGGTLSLTALASRALGRRTAFVFILGVIGAAMFLGDSVITPAISVLSAVEGLKLATPAFEHYVVPLTVVILIGLFAVQSRGTARVAAFFGPIMVVWFVAIAIAGAMHIRDDPRVLAAINPLYGVEFLLEHGEIGLVTLGAVFLVRHRRRGALCRSRPFRPQADPDRLALSGAAGAADQLFRAGRAGAGRSGRDRKSVLSPGAGHVPAADDRAGDRRHRDRQPGRHHRRLFAGASGDPARPVAAARHPAHLGVPCRARSTSRA